MNNSVAFSTFTVLYNHYLYLVTKHFITPNRNPIPTELLSLPLYPYFLPITKLLSVSKDSPLLDIS